MSNPVKMSREAAGVRDIPHSKLFLATLFLVAAMTLTVSGCNTMSGLGEDISTAGEELGETSEDIKN